MAKKIAIYPGTFDPITNGHFDLMKRGLKIFDQIIVAVAENSQKQTLLSLQQIIDLVNEVTKDIKAINVMTLNKLVVDFAKDHSATIILRGLRAISDFEYEVQLASINRSIEPSIESVFMSPAEKYGFLSSSIIKDIAKHGGDLSKFVNKDVLDALSQKLN